MDVTTTGAPDWAPFCRICGAAQVYGPDHCETDDWKEAVYCDQCGKAYADKTRDPDCVGCGSYGE